jgi:hypothetical protein
MLTFIVLIAINMLCLWAASALADANEAQTKQYFRSVITVIIEEEERARKIRELYGRD